MRDDGSGGARRTASTTAAAAMRMSLMAGVKVLGPPTLGAPARSPCIRRRWPPPQGRLALGGGQRAAVHRTAAARLMLFIPVDLQSRPPVGLGTGRYRGGVGARVAALAPGLATPWCGVGIAGFAPTRGLRGPGLTEFGG